MILIQNWDIALIKTMSLKIHDLLFTSHPNLTVNSEPIFHYIQIIIIKLFTQNLI